MQCNIPIGDRPKYLDGTVCLYKDEPYYVRAYAEDPRVFLMDFVDQRTKMHIILHDDPLFDVATPSLGYAQITKNRVVYISRRPHRRWKQGISNESLIINFIVKGGEEGLMWSFHCEGVRQCMKRVYDKPQVIYQKLLDSPEYAEYAISNDCALVRRKGMIWVYFREEEVGFIALSELKKVIPTVIVPSTSKAWIVSRYLQEFEFNVQ